MLEAVHRELVALAWALHDEPEAVFAVADIAADRLVGRRYATILRLEAGGQTRRLFSSVALTYPVGQTKLLPPSAWRAQVAERGEIFMAASPAEIATHFPDFTVVAGLGAQCLANVPIPGRIGEVVGLFNVASARAFNATELQCLRLLAALLGPAVAACSGH